MFFSDASVKYMLRHSLCMYAKYSNQLRSVMAVPNVVFVLGGPGAGKGTQCQNIVKVLV